MKISKKTLLKIGKQALSLLTIILIGVVLYNNQELVTRLWTIKPHYLVALILVNLFHAIAQSVNFQALIFGQGLDLKQTESFELTMAGRFYNFILPLKAGNVLRSVYLKKIHEFPYKNFLFFLFYQFISFLIIIPLIMAPLFFLIDGMALKQKSIFALIGLALSLVAFFLLKGSYFFKKFLEIKKAKVMVDKIPVLTRTHWMRITFGVALFWFANGLKMYIAFKAIDLDFSLLKCMAVSGAVLVITQIGITPGDMGSKEFIISFAAKLFQLPLAQGLLGALIDRAAEICITVPLGLIFGTRITRSRSINLQKHIEESKSP